MIYGCMLKLSSDSKCGNFALFFCRGRHGIVLNCVPHVQHALFYAFKLIKFFNDLWVVVSIFIVDAKTVVINNDLVNFFRVKSEVHHKTF